MFVIKIKEIQKTI